MKIVRVEIDHSQLWDAFRSGSSDAYLHLYDLFAGDLYRYGYHLVRNRQLVEDCLHELFLHLHESRLRLGPTTNIQFYLYRAMRRRLFDSVSRTGKFDSDDYVFTQAVFQVQSHECALIEVEEMEWRKKVVQKALNELPKRQKEALYLVYTKGMSPQQTAQVMDISVKSVYNTVNQALGALRTFARISEGTHGSPSQPASNPKHHLSAPAE